MPKYDVLLVSNSPGELSALVKPVAETMGRELENARVILVLTPCQYTSGKELDYIKTIRGISQTIPAEGYKNWVLLNRKPKINLNQKGIVLYLGGDLAHAMLIARKAGFPAFAYINDRIAWTRFYKKFFVPDADTQFRFAKNKALKKKIRVVGNLMVDSVADLKKWSPRKNVITLLPGSRAWQIKHMTPIYEKIIKHIKIEMPPAEFQLVSSPFEKAIGIRGTKTIGFEDAYNSELVITIPGTNTARLAAMGMPMISVFPLDDPDVIPLDGLPHYIGKIPYLGSKFKKTLIETLNQKVKYFALPNMKADREIVPEIRGMVEPAAVALKAISLLKDPEKRRHMSEELVQIMGKPGAALKITEEIDEALRQAA